MAQVRALPEHRIVYLKYKRRLVWHRPTRLDLIFGSGVRSGEGEGGAGATRIQDVVATYGEWEAARAQRLRRANARAAAALGGGGDGEGMAALGEVKQLLKRAAGGALERGEFVELALSRRYFGRRLGRRGGDRGGAEGAEPEGAEGAEDVEASFPPSLAAAEVAAVPVEEEEVAVEVAVEVAAAEEGRGAFLELVSTLPDEHAPLRDELTERIRAHAFPAASSET